MNAHQRRRARRRARPVRYSIAGHEFTVQAATGSEVARDFAANARSLGFAATAEGATVRLDVGLFANGPREYYFSVHTRTLD